MYTIIYRFTVGNLLFVYNASDAYELVYTTLRFIK